MTGAELALAAAPLVVGLVEVAKRSGLPTRWAGLASLLFGVLVALLIGDSWDRAAIVAGIAAGLSAAGLYSQAVTLREGGRAIDQPTQ